MSAGAVARASSTPAWACSSSIRRVPLRCAAARARFISRPRVAPSSAAAQYRGPAPRGDVRDRCRCRVPAKAGAATSTCTISSHEAAAANTLAKTACSSAPPTITFSMTASSSSAATPKASFAFATPKAGRSSARQASRECRAAADRRASTGTDDSTTTQGGSSSHGAAARLLHAIGRRGGWSLDALIEKLDLPAHVVASALTAAGAWRKHPLPRLRLPSHLADARPSCSRRLGAITSRRKCVES